MSDLKFTTAGEYMNDRIILSQYYSESDTRESIVERDPETQRFYVRAKSAFGTWFTTVFSSQQDAEDYAEDWVYGTET
jgi:hypothetical protein